MADTLLLNADGMPVGYMPLSTITWQDSIRYLVLNKADVIQYHDNWWVHSATWETQVPSVMMMRDYLKPKTTVRFSRGNVYLRDNCQCQYCGTSIERKDATLDHVLPVSKGGKSTWENCTTACGPCNASKSDKVKGWKPRIKPYKPEFYELVNKRKKLGFDNVRFKEWLQFII
jgi:5-methylcytosine-specific restriction endonuclease McrA